MKGQEFDARISSLDISLFDGIESATSVHDKRSLLDVQNAVRSLKDGYAYLEIGSHLGGSVQTYLLDHQCCKIFSIDKRPLVQSDERWIEGFAYPGNSTQRMLENLSKLTADVGKIACFDSDASDVGKDKIIPRPDICFIDGEHTNRKVVSDFQFCRSVLGENGVIIFHDAQVVAEGIDLVLQGLKKEKEEFRAYHLPDSIFVLELKKNEDFFKKINSQNIQMYSSPGISKIWRRQCRRLLRHIKNRVDR